MSQPSSPQLSLQFVVKALSNFLVPSSESLRGSEELSWRIAAHERPDLIDEVWKPWRTQALHNTLMLTAEEYGSFWERFRQLPPWFGGNVRRRVETFVYQEYQAFVHHLQQQRACTELLASLPQEFPDNKLTRLLELCFLPGVILPFCLATATYWAHVCRDIRKKKQSLPTLNRQIQNEPLLSPMVKATMAQEYSILTALLEEELRLAPLVTWKKDLGIDSNVKKETQKHKVWSLIFKELVDLLRPYCSGPKHWHLASVPGAVPEQAFKVASRLMHLAQPQLWPDRPTLVKSRYYAP